MKFKKHYFFLMTVFLIFWGNFFIIKAEAGEIPQTTGLSAAQVEGIETYVTKQIKLRKIPGLVLVIVTGKGAEANIYYKSFGLNSISPRRSLTGELLFPLGSNRESLTALGILHLVHDFPLKLTDPVSRYLPWLQLKGSARVGEITIEQLLYHTSGLPVLPEGSFGAGVESEARGAEKGLQKRLAGIVLQSEPGEKYLYSPLNYVLLELLIEKVTGQSYEDYLQQQVLVPFNLQHTFPAPNPQKMGPNSLAVGHKLEFLKPCPYVVPEDASNNNPYLWVTNAADMGNWLKANLEAQDPLVQESQRPDFYAVTPAGLFSAMGWKALQNRKNWLFNQDERPNYTSFLAFSSREENGIALLANINTDLQPLGWGIMELVYHRPPPLTGSVTGYGRLDTMAVIAIWVLTPFILAVLLFFGFFFKAIFRRERRFVGLKPKMVVGFILSLVYLGGIAFCLQRLPSLLFGAVSWERLQVWISPSIQLALILAAAAILLFYLYFILNRLFPKPGLKNIFPTIILSVVSGFGNALIIFVINLAFNVDNSVKISLFLFFIMGMVTYVYGQRLVRLNLIKVTADLVYNKRMLLIRNILKTHFYKLETIENGKILAVLNNDTETISNFINMAITGITAMVTLGCGLLYVGMINIYGLLLALLVSFLAAACYFLAGRAADRVWQKTRDLQNVFYNFIHDLLLGFKELSLNLAKQNEFRRDLEHSSADYRDNRIRFDLTWANMFVIGELMFTAVVGVIAFLFPLIFPALDSDATRSFVFVFFYLVGPVHGILTLIPNVLQTRTSWNRIEELLKEIRALEPAEVPGERAGEAAVSSEALSRSFTLELREVTYQYKSESGESFKVGPINCRFQAGQITFITGGNGSGKSTLAKLVTGLYHPDGGEILVDGVRVLPEHLSGYYAAIFSDFYLFNKLYGIDYRAKEQEIQKYLQLMQIEHKLQIKDGAFSTVRLSSGQRKRLALMISFLEDRPVYLFDEWAADQDPEFRRYFYHTLLPGLKEQGKCIIAITHDDRYFGAADQLLKMELGLVVEQSSQLNERKG